MARFVRFFVLSLVLMAVAVASALTAMRFAIHGREVAVPKLDGLTLSQADAIANDSGLIVQTSDKFYSAKIPVGRIVSQLPSPGTRVRRGWKVRVAESLGPPQIEVPDLTGESPRVAEIDLHRRGLELAGQFPLRVPAAAPPQEGFQNPSGEILAQSPPANAEEVASPKVSVLVAQPDDAVAYVMPSFIGRRVSEVQRLIEDAGMSIGRVSEAASDVPAVQSGGAPMSGIENGGAKLVAPRAAAKKLQSSDAHRFPDGTILRETPAPGQRVTIGSAIDFEITEAK